PTVTGRREEIERLAGENGVWLDGIRIVDAEEPAKAAVDLWRRCEVRLLMKGQIATPDLMRAILDQAGLRTGRVICQVVLMGVACPVVFMSRADAARTRLRSLALALRLA